MMLVAIVVHVVMELLQYAGEDALKESARRSWNDTSNAVLKFNKIPRKNWSISLYRPTYQLLTSYMENEEIRVKYAQHGAVFHVCVWIVGAGVALDTALNENDFHLWLVIGRLLHTVKNPDQTGNDGFVVRERWSSRLPVLGFGSQIIGYTFCPASLTYGHYKMA